MLDPQAFTENGKIRSYKVNVDKISSVDYRGLRAELFINGNENLKMNISIKKNDGKYELVGGYSHKDLDELLKQ